MKKIASLSGLIAYLAVARNALAITITPPNLGYHSLGTFITAVVNLVFIVGALAVLVMIVWGAVQWIFSGGEKEAVGKARDRILNALIGLAVLAVAVALAAAFGQFVGINIFQLIIPTPGDPNPVQPSPIPAER